MYQRLYQSIVPEHLVMLGRIDGRIIEEFFPTLREMTYLNNASTGILPTTAVEAMRRYFENRVRAIGTMQDTLGQFKRVRSKLAKLLGGSEELYALSPSTSAGLNTIAHGIDYPDDSNIVICDLEFPANYVPWQHVARLYGLELRVVPSRNGAIQLDDLDSMVDDKTQVVALSMVQFGTGYKADVHDIAKIVHEHDALFVVDIIQAAGWMEIDLPKMEIDFAAAQAAKWLMGPIGAGFIYINRDILDRVTPRYLGWWGVQKMDDFTYFQREPANDAKKFEVGSPAVAAYVGFEKSLDLLLSTPSEQRERAALEVADYLRERLDEIAVEYYHFEEKNRSPIVSCRPENVEEIARQLHKKNIHCSVRNGRLRISPHFYNSFEEVDRLIDNLEVD